MSTKVNLKTPKSPRSRSKSPPKVKKRKAAKNTYDIVQFKKMIGKGIITTWNGVVIDKKNMIEEAKKIKEKVLTGSIKSIGMSGYLNNGVLYIFNGIERLFVINSISYLEIKKANLDIEIIVNQYPKLTKEEVSQLNA